MPLLNRIRLLRTYLDEALWWRPALWSVVAVAAALVAALADLLVPSDSLPSLPSGVVEC